MRTDYYDFLTFDNKLLRGTYLPAGHVKAWAHWDTSTEPITLIDCMGLDILNVNSLPLPLFIINCDVIHRLEKPDGYYVELFLP